MWVILWESFSIANLANLSLVLNSGFNSLKYSTERASSARASSIVSKTLFLTRSDVVINRRIY